MCIKRNKKHLKKIFLNIRIESYSNKSLSYEIFYGFIRIFFLMVQSFNTKKQHQIALAALVHY